MKNPTQFLISFFLIILTSYQLVGQTRYNDIVPDAYLKTSQNFTIDINEDNKVDFEFKFKVTNEYDTYTYHYSVITSENSQVTIMEEDASVIKKGDTIDENLEWSNESEVLLYIVTQYYGEAGNWVDVDKGYLGLRIKVDETYYYAWLRIHADPHYFKMWVVDFAIENTGDTQIIAGDGIPSGGTSIFAQDKNDYFDGRDIKVSFTRAIDENIFSEYRIILAKAEDSTAYNLEKMSHLPENRFTAVTIDSSWENKIISYLLLKDAVDKDGDSVMSFSDYKIHLLNVAKSGNPTENILSTPSPPFILQSFTQAAFKPIAQDIGNSNNSSDVVISFEPAEEEWNLREYRIFLGLTEDAPYFDVQNALTLSEDFYTKYLPDGLDINLTLNTDQRDISGKMIKEGNLYQAIILSVADSIYSVTSVLSPPSREFKLSNPNYIVAGQKSGSYLVSYVCDSLFSNHSYLKDTVFIDLNRDGKTDFRFNFRHDISPMQEHIEYTITGLRNNKILLCSHENHENWVDILMKNESIGSEYNWSMNTNILTRHHYDSYSGINTWKGHLGYGFIGETYFLGFCIYDNPQPQYAWLRIDGTKFIEYAFQDFSSGVAEPKVKKEFMLYPNPAHNFIQLNNNDEKTYNNDVQVRFYNTDGILVDKFSFSGKSINYNISKLNPGVYYCKFNHPEGKDQSIKFVVY